MRLERAVGSLPSVMAFDNNCLSLARTPFTICTIESRFIRVALFVIGPIGSRPGGTRAGPRPVPRGTSHSLSPRMGFEYDKFKVQVKLAISRISSLQQRHQNSLCGRRKEIADLLKAGQEERARLLVLEGFLCCDCLHLNVLL